MTEAPSCEREARGLEDVKGPEHRLGMWDSRLQDWALGPPALLEVVPQKKTRKEINAIDCLAVLSFVGWQLILH